MYDELENYEERGEKNNWIDNFLKYKNITKLTREVVDELIDDIYVYEDGNIEITLRYKDEFKEAMQYVIRMKKLSVYEEDIMTI